MRKLRILTALVLIGLVITSVCIPGEPEYDDDSEICDDDDYDSDCDFDCD
jgi:hypothetical protein